MPVRFCSVVTPQWWIELHHDIRMLPLRANEVARIRFALLQLRHNLRRRIAPLVRVPPDFPDAAQILGRIEEHLDVVKLPHHRRMESEQPFHDDESPGLTYSGRISVPVAWSYTGLRMGWP